MIESINGEDMPDESVNTTAIFSIVGWGALLGAIACAYLSEAPYSGLDPLQRMICACLGWAAFVLVHVLSMRGLAGKLLCSPRPLALLATIGAGFALMPAFAFVRLVGASLPFAATAFSWIAFGGASGLAMLSWGAAWSTVASRQNADTSYTIARQTTWSMAIAALPCLLEVFTPPAVALALTLTLSLCSLVLLRTCHKHLVSSRKTRVLAQQNAQKAESVPERLLTRSVLTPLTRGLSFGVVFSFVAFSYPHPLALGLVVFGMALASIVIMGVLGKLRRVPRVPSVERATFPVLAATLLLSIVSGETLAYPLMLVAVTALLYQFILNSDAVSLRNEGVDSIIYCSQKNIVALVGVVLGFVAQTVLAALGVTFEDALLGLSLVLVFLMVLEPAFIPYMSYVAIEQIESHLESVEDTDSQQSEQGLSEGQQPERRSIP